MNATTNDREALCKRLLEYAFDEMPATARAAFATHLQTCRACQTEYQELRELGMLPEPGAVTPPVRMSHVRQIQDICFQQLQTQPQLSTAPWLARLRRRAPWLLATAAALMMIALTLPSTPSDSQSHEKLPPQAWQSWERDLQQCAQDSQVIADFSTHWNTLAGATGKLPPPPSELDRHLLKTAQQLDALDASLSDKDF